MRALTIVQSFKYGHGASVRISDPEMNVPCIAILFVSFKRFMTGPIGHQSGHAMTKLQDSCDYGLTQTVTDLNKSTRVKISRHGNLQFWNRQYHMIGTASDELSFPAKCQLRLQCGMGRGGMPAKFI